LLRVKSYTTDIVSKLRIIALNSHLKSVSRWQGSQMSRNMTLLYTDWNSCSLNMKLIL